MNEKSNIIEKKPVKLELKLDDSIAKGVYSNMAFVFNNETEFVLDFLFAEPTRAQGHVVSRVLTNPRAAKQLLGALASLVKRYEQQYGEIKSSRKDQVSQDNYH